MSDWDFDNEPDSGGRVGGFIDDDFGVSDEDIAKLGMERQMLAGLTPTAQARKILDEATPMAAMQLARLALNGNSDTVRLRASVEILNRTGVTDGDGRNGEGKEPWEDLFNKAVGSIEEFVNSGGQLPVKKAPNDDSNS